MIFNSFRGAHLDDEQMSCFIDGTCSEQDRLRIIKHLKSCVRCSESYREAVLYKGLWISGASDLETLEESIEFARQMDDRIKAGGPVTVGKEPARSFLLQRNYLRLITVAASFVIIVALGISYQFANRDEIPILDPIHIVPIQEAVELASMNSRLVIPGGERFIDTAPEVYRSGYVRINDSLRTAFAYFASEFQEDKTSRGVVYWLLGGYIATGQVSAARDLASQAIKEFPADIDMMTFDAIVSYMEGDFAASERTFRQVIKMDKDNPYANLNLAVLLYECGEEFEALSLLEHIVDEHSDSPFAVRARKIREEILGLPSIDS